ncbi:MAG TPA: hypothetical protein VMY42_04350 [Thermoguttaceae bacterium]|nr:hypothetical protein [Thermoguttaceae bacterium]
MIGAGGQAGQGDAANLLKPALARRELRTIAATTWAEYKKYFEKDAALARRFQVVKVEEPTEAVGVEMMRGLAKTLEVVSGWTGIPVGRMVTDEIRTVLGLKEKMEERIIGQSHALDAIAQRIRTSRANLTDPRRPIGVFLLVGTRARTRARATGRPTPRSAWKRWKSNTTWSTRRATAARSPPAGNSRSKATARVPRKARPS